MTGMYETLNINMCNSGRQVKNLQYCLNKNVQSNQFFFKHLKVMMSVLQIYVIKSAEDEVY